MPYQYPKSWIQEIQARFQQGKFGQVYIFEGLTTNNTATEIFIEGKTNRRLYLPKTQLAGWFEFSGLAYNTTDGNVMTVYNRMIIAFERLANGTFQLANGVDLDGAGAEGNPIILGTAATAAPVARAGAANAVALAIQGSGLANDPYISVTVTGQTSKNIIWRLECRPYVITLDTEQSLTEGV